MGEMKYDGAVGTHFSDGNVRMNNYL